MEKTDVGKFDSENYTIYSAKTGPWVAVIDQIRTIRSWQHVLALAYLDVKLKYRRSVLGPLWNVLGTVAFIIGFVILGSFIFRVDRAEYLTYLSAGIIFWQFISACLNDSTQAFTQNHVYILSNDTPLGQYVLRSLFRNIILLLHNLPILIGIALYKSNINFASLLFFPTFFLLCILLFLVGQLLAYLAARFRDLTPAVSILTQFFFYFTPIFWSIEAIPEGRAQLIYLLSPFYHMLNIMRAPIMGSSDIGISIIFILSATLLFCLLTLLIVTRFKKRLAYWL